MKRIKIDTTKKVQKKLFMFCSFNAIGFFTCMIKGACRWTLQRHPGFRFLVDYTFHLPLTGVVSDTARAILLFILHICLIMVDFLEYLCVGARGILRSKIESIP